MNGYLKVALIFIAVLSVFAFRHYVINRVVVNGSSMNNTFFDGDVLWERKYGLDDLSRFDVVTARIDGKFVIKRIVGLPGETLQVINEKLYVNGSPLKDYIQIPIKDAGCLDVPVVLSNDEYFLMGDNRNDSIDSRKWGAVNKSKIDGVVFYQIFPFTKIGKTS